MKNDLEEKLNKIKIKKLESSEKNEIWSGVVFINSQKPRKTGLLFNLKKGMIGAILSLMVVLGGGGAVMASSSSLPGDALYGVNLAKQKVILSLAGDDKKEDLRLRFTEEKSEKIKKVIEERAGVFMGEIDLSSQGLQEIEVDIFHDVTLVKIEASGKKYGFLINLKDRGEIISEISKRYNLTEDKIKDVINFEIEDRNVRPNDKEFLNRLKERRVRHVGAGLDMLDRVIQNPDISDETRERLENLKNEISQKLEERGLSLEDLQNTTIDIKKDGKIEFKDYESREKKEEKFEKRKENESKDDDRGRGRGRDDVNDDD